MKTLSYITAFLFIWAGLLSAQITIGYVDSDTVLDKLPDAQDARQQLDQIIQEWQAELQTLEKEWKTKYDDYDKRRLILTDEARMQIEAELVKMEQKIVEYREKKFGTNGELFTKQDELMKPVQNRVFNAITAVAKELDLDFVLDRSGGVLILYAKEEHDITAQVLEKLK
ncbi:MAG: OmpH family outer membrane protein [Ignavibacteriaceae bacterium]|nr:OmpH family outer membrane protein [Ignavibacteriaceae bacterium]